ncbi:MAG: nitroreductase [Chloroflexi bacterium]|nr:nitroreductase [Chloroflexota bacterium]
MSTDMINSSEISIPDTQTSVYEAIFGRRMTKELTGVEVPRSVLERMLEAAIWAPNHRLTNPWRFIVLAKDSPIRKQVAELTWQTTYDNVANPNPEQKKNSADASKSRVLDAPAMMYAYSAPGPDEETTQENYASVCCAVHNMALAAVAEGLVLDWSTGGISKLPGLAKILGADEDWAMVGALFIGEPVNLPTSRRDAAPSIVSWLS